MLRLKRERLKMKLTQQKVGADTNISYADISRIENGRLIPYPGHLKRLAEYFKIPEEELTKEE